MILSSRENVPLKYPTPGYAYPGNVEIRYTGSSMQFLGAKSTEDIKGSEPTPPWAPASATRVRTRSCVKSVYPDGVNTHAHVDGMSMGLYGRDKTARSYVRTLPRPETDS